MPCCSLLLGPVVLFLFYIILSCSFFVVWTFCCRLRLSWYSIIPLPYYPIIKLLFWLNLLPYRLLVQLYNPNIVYIYFSIVFIFLIFLILLPSYPIILWSCYPLASLCSFYIMLSLRVVVDFLLSHNFLVIFFNYKYIIFFFLLSYYPSILISCFYFFQLIPYFLDLLLISYQFLFIPSPCCPLLLGPVVLFLFYIILSCNFFVVWIFYCRLRISWYSIIPLPYYPIIKLLFWLNLLPYRLLVQLYNPNIVYIYFSIVSIFLVFLILFPCYPIILWSCYPLASLCSFDIILSRRVVVDFLLSHNFLVIFFQL